MIYYGPQTNIDYNKDWFRPNGDQIIVMQQHCGGENLMVFKGFVKPNRKSIFFFFQKSCHKCTFLELFTFDSYRHADYPFAIALYINGLINSRISVCCEYKHKHHVRLGSKHGLFGIYKVCNSKPCRR